MAERSNLPDFFSKAVKQANRFFLDLAPSEETALAVVCGGYEQCEKDYSITRDSFPYYSIEFVVRGKGNVVLDGVEHSLAAGSVFAYGPGVRHEIYTDQRSRLGKYFVDFTGQSATELLRTAGLSPGECAAVAPAGEVQLIFNELLRDGARKDDLSASMCEAMLQCLCLRIHAYRAESTANSQESYATYQRCVSHIDAEAVRLTSLKQVAEECELDPSYLARLFQRHGRQTPYQYLTRVRMNLAAERLLDSTLAVSEVATEFGYTDPFHFSRTFKATFGVSPSMFRSLR